MTPDEAAAFEAESDFPAAIALRRADDARKVRGLPSLRSTPGDRSRSEWPPADARGREVAVESLGDRRSAVRPRPAAS
ncbi:hypothetical protein GCM10010260_28620 [Streptomyces filipinensis]|uniref:Uncharacterized protein n=1 Tax=Streptomyces filipinensis TaxID=66887 RepID=A0A918IA35_9ACTN|nr:hypothetical protein [Streptomyces filipinensis]GGU92273.1 hypothetical protein GCM10010260_28620 [Streptomyces filipinensis]